MPRGTQKPIQNEEPLSDARLNDVKVLDDSTSSSSSRSSSPNESYLDSTFIEASHRVDDDAKEKEPKKRGSDQKHRPGSQFKLQKIEKESESLRNEEMLQVNKNHFKKLKDETKRCLSPKNSVDMYEEKSMETISKDTMVKTFKDDSLSSSLDFSKNSPSPREGISPHSDSNDMESKTNIQSNLTSDIRSKSASLLSVSITFSSTSLKIVKGMHAISDAFAQHHKDILTCAWLSALTPAILIAGLGLGIIKSCSDFYHAEIATRLPNKRGENQDKKKETVNLDRGVAENAGCAMESR